MVLSMHEILVPPPPISVTPVRNCAQSRGSVRIADFRTVSLRVNISSFSWPLFFLGWYPAKPPIKQPAADKQSTSALIDNVHLEMLKSGHDEGFLEALASGEVEIDWSDEDGAGFLHHAVWLKNTGIAGRLIAAGANVNARRQDGYTPMHLAAYHGHVELLELLANSGGQVNAAGSGTTPLYWAAAREHKEAALYLISRGADAKLKGRRYAQCPAML